MLRVGYRFWTVAVLLALLVAACGGQGVDQDLFATPTVTPALPSPTPPVLSPLPATAFTSPLSTIAPPAASPSAPLIRPPLTRSPTPQAGRQPTAGCERLPLGRARSQEEIVALARQWLAERLGVPLEKVEVVSVEEELWDEPPNCLPSPPAKVPDRAYPGPLPGYRIILAAEGAQYEYHSGRLWLLFCGMLGG